MAYTESIGRRIQDPQDTRIWAFDWATFLTERSTTISSATWTVPSGLTKVSESNTTTTATVKVSGGTHGTDYLLTCTATLANGETVEKSFTLAVRQS